MKKLRTLDVFLRVRQGTGVLQRYSIVGSFLVTPSVTDVHGGGDKVSRHLAYHKTVFMSYELDR